jgi:hypothetical protein
MVRKSVREGVNPPIPEHGEEGGRHVPVVTKLYLFGKGGLAV